MSYGCSQQALTLCAEKVCVFKCRRQCLLVDHTRQYIYVLLEVTWWAKRSFSSTSADAVSLDLEQEQLLGIDDFPSAILQGQTVHL